MKVFFDDVLIGGITNAARHPNGGFVARFEPSNDFKHVREYFDELNAWVDDTVIMALEEALPKQTGRIVLISNVGERILASDVFIDNEAIFYQVPKLTGES